MSLHLRILLGYALVVSLAVFAFIYGAVKELRPGVRQATEQTLVNTANLLAELAAPEILEGSIDQGRFKQAVDAFLQRRFNAKIWHLTYDEPDMRIYVADAKGRVVFDSVGLAVGQDYSDWNDVLLTLQGQYGVRSTLADPDDKASSVMYVAAPILYQGQRIGVLTVSRPTLSMQPYVEFAQSKVRLLGAGLLLAALAVSVVISFWITRSIRKLTRYADDVKAGKRLDAPRLAEKELARLSHAMATMRNELEGKEYVEHYVHTLTHEIKSPLTAVSAATEILEQNPSLSERQRFLNNIKTETRRMQQLVERLLNLATVEKRAELRDVAIFSLGELLAEVVPGKMALLEEKTLTWSDQSDHSLRIRGEAFLLRQALGNLIDNAIDFSPKGGTIGCRSELVDGQLSIEIGDQGPGIPDYALDRVTERFYSLPRPDGGEKSTGLGLAFVHEVAELHQGRITLTNQIQGAVARFQLPVAE